MDREIATILNQEGFIAARGCAFKGENVWLLRSPWGIPTVKINGVGANPMRWPDGSFSIQGVAAELEITLQTVFDYLARGLLSGRQLTKGQPWQRISQTNKSLSCAPTCDAPDVQKRRPHEAIGSGKTLFHFAEGLIGGNQHRSPLNRNLRSGWFRSCSWRHRNTMLAGECAVS
jgi:hypothetical protein